MKITWGPAHEHVHFELREKYTNRSWKSYHATKLVPNFDDWSRISTRPWQLVVMMFRCTAEDPEREVRRPQANSGNEKSVDSEIQHRRR